MALGIRPAQLSRRRDCQPICACRSKSVNEFGADEGISGTTTKKREQFNRMIEDCKAGKIDMIITKSVAPDEIS